MNDDNESPERPTVDRAVVRMVFDAVLALVVATVGYTVHGIHGELDGIKLRDKEHAEALSTMRERLPLDYVRMDLYMRDRQEIKAVLDRIDMNVREHRERTGTNGTGVHGAYK